MRTVKEFDPKRCTLAIGGKIVSGFPEGSKFSLTQDTGFTTTQEGTDGDVVINVNNKTVGTFTFNLFQTASFNDIMYTWALAYRNKTGPYRVPFEFNDPSGAACTSECWLEMQGDYGVAEQDSSMTWTLKVLDATLKPNVNVARLTADASILGLGI